MTVDNHQQVFLIGDLNFRINALTRQQVLEKIEANKCDELLKEDDLIVAFERYRKNPGAIENKHMEFLFKNFMEG